MKILEDGTIRIEYEDKDNGIYLYKDITKEMILGFKNLKRKKKRKELDPRKQGDIFIDNIPDKNKTKNEYIESAHYRIIEAEIPFCSFFITQINIQNGNRKVNYFTPRMEL